ncbi:MAG TPA: MFS transporter, partial [Caulobacteraceae bacterium]
VLKVADLQTNFLLVVALVIATPSYLLFGWLSDRIGRKPIIVIGCALGALSILPAFHALTAAANPALAMAQRAAPVVVYADPRACSVQFDPVGANQFDSSDCDIAKAMLSRAGISYRTVALAAGARTQIHIGERTLSPPDPRGLAPAARAARIAGFAVDAKAALATVGYPPAADPARVDSPAVIAIVVALLLLAAMTYAPTSAFLVELFPARIRYTSLSVPYHLGTGWVGGLLPATAFAIVAANGNIYAGLWYPVFFCALSTIVALLFLPETRGRPIEG